MELQSIDTDAAGVKLVERMAAEAVPPLPGHKSLVDEWAVLMGCMVSYEPTDLYQEGVDSALDYVINGLALRDNPAFDLWAWRRGMPYIAVDEFRRAWAKVSTSYTTAAQKPGVALTAAEREELENPTSPLA